MGLGHLLGQRAFLAAWQPSWRHDTNHHRVRGCGGGDGLERNEVLGDPVAPSHAVAPNHGRPRPTLPPVFTRTTSAQVCDITHLSSRAMLHVRYFGRATHHLSLMHSSFSAGIGKK